MKILIVDVDRLSVERISAIIRDWGWSVETACCGDDAVVMVSKFEYDAVLVDVSGASRDEIEIIRRLKEARPSVNLAAMNGQDYYNLEFEAELKKNGVLYYTIKPSNRLILQRVLEHLLIRFEIKKGAEGRP